VSSVVPVALGAAWGMLAGLPLARRARRVAGRARVRVLRPRAPHAASPGGSSIARSLGTRLGPVGRVVRALWARRAATRVDAAVGSELPVTIDLLGVAVGAGCTPYVAVEVAAGWAPPVLRDRLESVRRSCALGAGFGHSLEDTATEIPRLRPLVDALLASDRYGAPVADALSRLAAEERAAVRRRAEARARTVPVRLLFPLVFLVLPAFGLLTVVPTLLTGFAGQ